MLKDYIEQQGAECNVVRNDAPELIHMLENNHFDAVVISPGPCTPNEAGSLPKILHNIIRSYPVLGVCLGHQAIGEYFGADLQKADVPKHGKVDHIHHNGNELFKGIPEVFEATRYHSLLLKEVPIELEVIATSSTNEVMGIAHKTLPLWGIQFHPESCMTGHGKRMIKNFLLLAKQKP
jgi:anthranilate synthase/aminodeoxychorismate synthase-like glutamine amidotransferase